MRLGRWQNTRLILNPEQRLTVRILVGSHEFSFFSLFSLLGPWQHTRLIPGPEQRLKVRILVSSDEFLLLFSYFLWQDI